MFKHPLTRSGFDHTRAIRYPHEVPAPTTAILDFLHTNTFVDEACTAAHAIAVHHLEMTVWPIVEVATYAISYSIRKRAHSFVKRDAEIDGAVCPEPVHDTKPMVTAIRAALERHICERYSRCSSSGRTYTSAMSTVW